MSRIKVTSRVRNAKGLRKTFKPLSVKQEISDMFDPIFFKKKKKNGRLHASIMRLCVIVNKANLAKKGFISYRRDSTHTSLHSRLHAYNRRHYVTKGGNDLLAAEVYFPIPKKPYQGVSCVFSDC